MPETWFEGPLDLHAAGAELETPGYVRGLMTDEYRWTIEVFFRFFKQILGCRHLLSTRAEGIEIQVYAAVICCLLLNTLTGRKPDKRLVTLMAFWWQGVATDADVLAELNRPDNTGVKLRKQQAENDRLWAHWGI